MSTNPTYEIIFDGGSLGNPGHGYGSYRIQGPNEYHRHDECDYAHLGDRVTNNQAEYLTLIAALERLGTDLGEKAGGADVRVLGDSMLVIRQLKGEWKVKNPELKPLHYRASVAFQPFHRHELIWQPRSASVRVLGH